MRLIPPIMATPKNLQAMRESAGLTVAQAAALLQIEPRSLRRYEDGTRQMPPALVHAYSHWLRGEPAPVPVKQDS